ncbi:MAG: amidohydrolase family protein [Candidatus Rokubacteria bacterium]|nr:amidohydrolase family protein [Candidatus Rokubacteria bacterium]
MRLVLLGGQVITGDGTRWERGVVVVDGETISEIADALAYRGRPEDRVIDLEGHTVLPGIIDCHAHLTLDGGPNNVQQARADTRPWATIRALRNAAAALSAGVTTLRDAGGDGEVVFAVRDAIARGLATGPRVVACGRPVCITGGHGWWIPGLEADGPAAVRQGVRSLVKGGADAIKLMATGGLTEVSPDVGMRASQMEEDELAAGVAEARKAGRRTPAHAHGAEGARRAARAGVDSIDHGIFLDDEACGIIAERGAWYTPTLRATAPSPLKTVDAGCPAHIVERHRIAQGHHAESFRRALRAGVRIGYGTDSGSTGNTHGENLAELALMVDLGLPPLAALHCATAGAARLLGLDDRLGTLAPGKQADLIVARGDVLADIRSLADPHTVRAVVRGGEIVVAKDGLVARNTLTAKDCH